MRKDALAEEAGSERSGKKPIKEIEILEADLPKQLSVKNKESE